MHQKNLGSVQPGTAYVPHLKFDYKTQCNLRTVLVSVEVVCPDHIGFDTPCKTRAESDVYSTASLVGRRVLVAERRLWSEVRIPAQHVGPKFQAAWSGPPEPRASHSKQEPATGVELV